MSKFILILIALSLPLLTGCLGTIEVDLHTKVHWYGACDFTYMITATGALSEFMMQTMPELNQKAYEFDRSAQIYAGKEDNKWIGKISLAFRDLNLFNQFCEQWSKIMLESAYRGKGQPDSGFVVPTLKLSKRKHFFSTEYIFQANIKAASLIPNVCSSCQGSGKEKCWYCRGFGTVDCDSCGGEGEVYDPYFDRYRTCFVCQGKGTMACPECDGFGWLYCPACNGTGYPSDLDKWVQELVNTIFNFNFVVSLPGQIRSHNAQRREGGDLYWRFSLEQIERGPSIYANSICVNWLNLYICISLVMAASSLSIYLVKRGRRRRLVER